MSAAGETKDRTPIAEIVKNGRGDLIRISLSEFEGHHLIDVRQFFTTKDGKVLGSKKGCSLNIRLIDKLIEGLCAARRAAMAKDWLPTGGEG